MKIGAPAFAGEMAQGIQAKVMSRLSGSDLIRWPVSAKMALARAAAGGAGFADAKDFFTVFRSGHEYWLAFPQAQRFEIGET